MVFRPQHGHDQQVGVCLRLLLVGLHDLAPLPVLLDLLLGVRALSLGNPFDVFQAVNGPLDEELVLAGCSDPEPEDPLDSKVAAARFGDGHEFRLRVVAVVLFNLAQVEHGVDPALGRELQLHTAWVHVVEDFVGPVKTWPQFV